MYGGIEDCGPSATKIAPCGDIYSMRLSLSKSTFKFFEFSKHFIFLNFFIKTTPLFFKYWNWQINYRFHKLIFYLNISIFRGMPLGTWEKVCCVWRATTTKSSARRSCNTKIWSCLHLRWSCKPNSTLKRLLVAQSLRLFLDSLSRR